MLFLQRFDASGTAAFVTVKRALTVSKLLAAGIWEVEKLGSGSGMKL